MPTSLRIEIFAVDLNATVRFYVELLGFGLVTDRRADPRPYIAMQRDGVRIGAVLWRDAVAGPDRRSETDFSSPRSPRSSAAVDVEPAMLARCRRPPTGVEIVLEVDYLHAERDRIRAAGWPIDEDIVRRPWGLQDFRVLDPDGYYLRFTHAAR